MSILIVNPISRTIRIITWLVLIFLGQNVIAQTPSSPCKDSENYHKFDYWVGSWRVEGPKGKVAGTNKIEKILDGCVILENWSGAGQSKGKSFNYFNRHTGKWYQHWVDNFGQTLELEGDIQNGVATFTGESLDFKGNPVQNRLTITKISDNEVRQLWKQSKNNEEWSVVFDGRYVRQE